MATAAWVYPCTSYGPIHKEAFGLDSPQICNQTRPYIVLEWEDDKRLKGKLLGERINLSQL